VEGKNKLHSILSAVGILAWSVFILGCLVGSVAWSPNGSKIAFSYYDPTAKEDGVMIYDRERNSLIPTYVANGSNDEGVYIQSQWDRTGSRLLIESCLTDKNGKDHFDLLALSTNPQRSVRHFTLPSDQELPMLPAPEKGPKLFLSGKQLVTVNLDTGETQSDDRFGELALYPAGDSILYRRDSSDKTAEEKKVTRMEFGIFDPDTSTLHSSFTILQTELEARGINKLVGFAVRDTGFEFATVGQRSQGQDVIVLLNGNGIEHVLAPQLLVQEPFKLGSLAWGRNGNIYAATAIRVDDEIAQFAIAEIPVAGGAARLVPIARVNWDIESSGFGDTFYLTERIALSPDGRTLATSTAAVAEKEITADNRALFLIDLTGPNRKVTRIPISVAKTQARR
jgi:hypothetical protein